MASNPVFLKMTPGEGTKKMMKFYSGTIKPHLTINARHMIPSDKKVPRFMIGECAEGCILHFAFDTAADPPGVVTLTSEAFDEVFANDKWKSELDPSKSGARDDPLLVTVDVTNAAGMIREEKIKRKEKRQNNGKSC
jgi:hypothetical protein